MSKYVIELDEDVKILQSISVTPNGNAYTNTQWQANLEKLNSDYINEHFSDLQDTAYQRGLNDAWEAARKIVKMPDPPYWGVFDEYKDDLFRKITAAEAIAKLKAYEEKQKTDNCIEIGDEVEWDGDKCIVTNRHIDINTGVIQDYDLMMWNGSVVAHVKKCSFVKTDRHFDIDKILMEIKGGNDK